MATFGYGALGDRAFVGFDKELEEGAWKKIVTKKYDDAVKESVVVLLSAPRAVVWKLRMRLGIAGVVSALGATSLGALDAAWDAAQRRLFHKLGAAMDDEDPAVRAAADRLWPQLLAGTGIGQTQYDYDDEVDFGRKQVALTHEGGPLASDAKTAGLESALADVRKTTEALAAGLGRPTGEKRRAPSKQLRDAVAECAGIFNGVHEELAWFVRKTEPGADRDHLSSLLAPLEALLTRATPPAATATEPAPPATPASPEPPKPA